MSIRSRNWEIATFALYLLDGIVHSVNTEDVALKCFELAPDCFSWINYPQYPDKDVARSALMDARKSKNGNLVQGRAGRGKGHSQRTKMNAAVDGWMLTEAGIKWIRDNETRLKSMLQVREASSQRQDIRHKLARVRSHALYQIFLDDPSRFNPSLGEMADLFRCRVDADRITWEKRFKMFVNLAQAASDDKMLRFLQMCKTSYNKQSTS